MLAYIATHMGYIIVTLVLILIVTAIITRMVRDRKSGQGGCGCGCQGCANAPYCHPQNASGAHVSVRSDRNCPG